MNVRLELQGDAVALGIKAQSGARRNGITGVHDGRLRVSVTQVAEKGKANAAIVEVLCKRLDLRKHQLELIAGETSPLKTFLVHRVTLDEFAERVAAALEGDQKLGGSEK